jgi:hypothetical protein
MSLPASYDTWKTNPGGYVIEYEMQPLVRVTLSLDMSGEIAIPTNPSHDEVWQYLQDEARSEAESVLITLREAIRDHHLNAELEFVEVEDEQVAHYHAHPA